MKKGLVITLVILGILVAGGIGGFLWLTAPTTAKAYDEPGISYEDRASIGRVRDFLGAYDVNTSYVTFGSGNAYVGYELPTDTNWTRDDLQHAALYGLAQGFPSATTGYAVLFVDEKPVLQWQGDLAALRKVPADDAAAWDSYFATVTKTDL